MKLSQDKIKEILDNAPAEAVYWYVNDSGAPDYDPINVYYDEHFNDCHKCGTSLREEWHAFPVKLSDLRAQLDPEQGWEDGLPPVGVECEYLDKNHSEKWIKVKIKYRSEWGVVFESVDIAPGTELFKNSYEEPKFRPIETPEQKAAREQKEWVDSVYKEIEGHKCTCRDALNKLYELNYRKESNL